jgi:polysaccharide biosynthesis transport protein
MVNEMGTSADEGRTDLRGILAVLRLRKWTIMLVTALILGGAIFASFRMTPIYESSARVLVEPIVINPTQTFPDVDIATEAGIADSVAVAEMVVERLELDRSALSLLANLTVEPVEASDFLLFRYSSPNPAEAQRMAQGFAEAFLTYRRKQAIQDYLDSRRVVQGRITGLQEQVSELNEELLATANPAEQSIIQSDLNRLNAQISLLEGQFALQPAPLGSGEIVEPAQLPQAPASPNHVVNGVLAFLLGLFAGIGVAFLRERLDDRLRGSTDFEARLGRPVLAVVPRVASWRRKSQTPLVTLAEPRSSSSEAYRTLRTSLLFAASQQGVKTILVTSPSAGDGKTATSANLAAVLAQARKRVILISADLRKPRLHRFFNLSNDVGLTSVLIGEAKPSEAVLDIGMEHLKVVPSGPVPGNPAELLGSDAMGAFLSRLREIADFVILDTAPALVVADPLTLAPITDAALFVADAEHTSRSAVTHAGSQLEQVGANIIGGVLNNFDPSKAKSSPYYYSYYYTSRYQAVPERPGRLRRGRRLGEEAPRPEQEGLAGSQAGRRTDRERPRGPDVAVSNPEMAQLWTSEPAPSSNNEQPSQAVPPAELRKQGILRRWR